MYEESAKSPLGDTLAVTRARGIRATRDPPEIQRRLRRIVSARVVSVGSDDFRVAPLLRRASAMGRLLSLSRAAISRFHRSAIAAVALLALGGVAACAEESEEIGSSSDEALIFEEAAAVEACREQPIDGHAPTALQKHARFFDRDCSGTVTVSETYRALRTLRLGRTSATIIAAGTVGANAVITRHLTVNIDVHAIQKGKHGSDTGIFDEDGNFSEATFESFFERFDANRDGGLDLSELTHRTWEDKETLDPVGVSASGGEFALLWFLARQDGKLTKDRLRSFYEGTLFYTLASEHR
jgi:hypothetical protein